MAKLRRDEGNHIEILDPEEGYKLLDEQARLWLNMSAAEFLEAWESGKFDDDPDRPEVMHVAMLIEFARDAREDAH